MTLPAITSVPLNTIPPTARSTVVTDEERAYVAALVATITTSDTGASIGAYTDKATADKAARSIKSLVKRVGASIPKGKAIRWSVGASGDGFAIFARIGDPATSGAKPKG